MRGNWQLATHRHDKSTATIICATIGELLQIYHNVSEMEVDRISSNTGEVVMAAAPTNTSEDDPRKKTENLLQMDNLLQISSIKRKNDKGVSLCKVDGCAKFPQREREGFCVTHHKMVTDAGGHVRNEVGSSVAAPTSSSGGPRKRERTNNGPITNLLSRQVLSLVPNITIPEQVNMFICYVNSKRLMQRYTVL